MTAILKREFKSYFNSMLGYVYLTIFLLLTGVVFFAINISNAVGTMTGFFSNVNAYVVFILPILTMRMFSEDRKQKTDQLLLTAPISITSMVLGKYLAAVGVFLVGCAVTLIYPAIMSFFGVVPFAETLSCYIGFVLLCMSIIAVGAFMSSLTESQIVAAISTYGVLIVTMFIGNYISGMSNEVLVKMLMWISPIIRFSEFTVGILDIEAIVYYLTFIALFIFLTVNVFERRCWS